MPLVPQNRRTDDVRESLLSRVKLSHSFHASAPTACAVGLVGEEPVKSAGNSFARVVQGTSSCWALRMTLRALAGAGLAWAGCWALHVCVVPGWTGPDRAGPGMRYTTPLVWAAI